MDNPADVAGNEPQQPVVAPEGTPAPSEGEPVVALTPEGSTPSEGAVATPAPEDAGTDTRFAQENQSLRSLVSKFGVDPDSQTARDIASGLINPQDLVQQPMAPAPQPATPAAPSDPLALLEQSLSGNETVTQDVYKRDMSAMINLLKSERQERTVKNEQQEFQDNMQRCMQATVDTYNGSEEVKAIPDDLRSKGQAFVEGATDIMVARELVPRYGQEKAWTPQGYSTCATQVTKDFAEYTKACIEHGKQLALNPNAVPTPSPNANPNAARISPVAPGVGPAAPIPSGLNTRENLAARAANFLNQQKMAV